MEKILIIFIVVVSIMISYVFSQNPVCLFSNDPIMCVQVSKLNK